MKQFWALVGNTQRLKRKRRLGLGIWSKIYVTFFIILGLAGYSLAIYQGKAGPYSLLIAIPYLLFINFGLSLRSIKQEWRDQTVTWWLTLPYSRIKLLSAKLVANFIHFLKVVATAAAISAVMAVEGIFLNPDIWTTNTLMDVAGIAAKLYALVIVISPLFITLGMLFALIMQSRLKPALPIPWAVSVYLMITTLNHATRFLGFDTTGGTISVVPQIPPFNLTVGIYLLVLPLFISGLFFCLSAYILSEQTEV